MARTISLLVAFASIPLALSACRDDTGPANARLEHAVYAMDVIGLGAPRAFVIDVLRDPSTEDFRIIYFRRHGRTLTHIGEFVGDDEQSQSSFKGRAADFPITEPRDGHRVREIDTEFVYGHAVERSVAPFVTERLARTQVNLVRLRAGSAIPVPALEEGR